MSAPYFIHKNPIAVELVDLSGILVFRSKCCLSGQVHQLIYLKDTKIALETMNRKIKEVGNSKSPFKHSMDILIVSQ